MSSSRAWRPDTELPEATTWLLEASAGTGKTYQISDLIVRHVAELAIPLDRILAITFTEAATRELKNRIRGRLRDCLQAVMAHRAGGAGAAELDPILERVLRRVGDETLVTRRLEAALRSFDLAPISTIHGFCQRMLRELAFESGQEASLELLPDKGEVLGRIVDDTLCSIYAEVDARHVATLELMGLTRDRLLDVAKVAGGPVAPEVVPAMPEAEGGLRALLEAHEARVRHLVETWRRLGDALLEDAATKLFEGMQRAAAKSRLDKLTTHLEMGDLARCLEECRDLRAEPLRARWRGDSAIETRSWWPAVAELEALLNALNPLAVFAATARARVEAELLRRRGLTFDGMLSRLAERIEREGGAGSPLAGAIRARFDAAFVDEFQDTDAAQWTTLRAAFHGHRRLFLIGDPKQAIFGFRGADVHVYQRAAARVDAAHRRTMRDNWRSDPASVDASNALWREGSRAFEDDAIDYVQVEARRGRRLAAPEGICAPGEVPGLDVRWVDARVLSGDAGVGRAIGSKDRIPLPRLVAREVLAWLAGRRGRLAVGGEALDVTPPPPTRAVVPGDLAIIVATHQQAAELRSALGAVGVPAVAASTATVYESAAAAWITAWLDAVAGGGRTRAARRAVVTPLFGWSMRELAWSLAHAGAAGASSPVAPGGEPPGPERDWSRWAERLRRAAERWPREGFARVFDREARECGIFERLLARAAGERDATDVRHLFELLNAEDRRVRSSPSSLAAWLRDQADSSAEEHAQRLESDEDAVRIATVHASKGLEYPIVLLPYAWEHRSGRDPGGPLILRDGDRTRLSLWQPGTPEREADRRALAAEERREEIRRLYVALTRAAHQTVVWFGPLGSKGLDPGASALGRLLLRGATADPQQVTYPQFPAAKSDAAGSASAAAMQEVERRLNELTTRSAGIVWSTEPQLPDGPDPRHVAAIGEAGEPPLRAAAWPGWSLRSPWWRTSFSALARAAAVDGADLDEPRRAEDRSADGDEAAGEALICAKTTGATVELGALPELDPGSPAAEPSPAGPRLGRGTRYGDFVHDVLQSLDFASARGGAAPAGKDGTPLDELLDDRARRHGFDADPEVVADLARALPGVLLTPLDTPTAGAPELPRGLCLADLAARDRADELAFDLRLGAGSAWRRAGSGDDGEPVEPLGARPGCVDPVRVSAALRLQPAPPGSPLARWLAALAERQLLPSVTGLLTGTIDLLFRVGDGAARRYLVVDYKTNRIRSGETSRYDQAALEWEMARAGYFLQSLVYTLALHRHLRLRLRGYDYDRDVGGYLYLFLRGMGGPATPRDAASGRCLGVYPGRWAREVVEALDAALCPGEVTP